MKEKLTIIGIVLFIGLCIIGFIAFAKLNNVDIINDLKPNYCIEDGICEVGQTIIDDGTKVIITKEYCLEKQYKWNEEKQICYLN